MSTSPHAERSGPKQSVGSLIHSEHGINAGAVDSLARKMVSRLSTYPQLSPADVFNDHLSLWIESDGGEVPSNQTEVKSRWGREKRKLESESGCTLMI